MGSVTLSGPLFDGRAVRALEEFSQNAEKSIATLGASMVRQDQARTYKIETPIARMKTEPKPDNGHWKIWQQNLIYSWWLEGIGSRNRSTRFKGYWNFRRTTAVIQARAVTVATNTLARYIGRMT